MEVLNKFTGERVFYEHNDFKSEQEFFEEHPKLVVYILEGNSNMNSDIGSDKI